MKKIVNISFFLVLMLMGLQLFAQLPTADFSTSGTCAGVAVTFKNLSNSTNVLWDFGDGNDTRKENPQHIYSAPGSYKVKLTVYLNDRSNVKEVTLVISASPAITLTYSKSATQDTVRMWVGENVTAQISESYPKYEWYLGQGDQWIKQSDTDASFSTSRAGKYRTWVQNSEGCANEANFVVLTTERPDDIIYTTIIVLNNIVTPNNDGLNDVLNIKYLGDPAVYEHPLIISIYNKAGALMYSSKDYANDWNATDMSGAPLSTGTYYFVATSEGRRGKTGYVDIIRSE